MAKQALQKEAKQVPEDVRKISDKTLSMVERKAAYQRTQNKVLNPKKSKDFDPEKFDPMEDVPDYEVKKRDRVEPPKRLPTLGMKPKKLLEGQMIGMYESKQDLYLLIAWLSERVSDLEDQLNNT